MEKHELHHLRLRNALIAHKLKPWPYEGKVGIKELNLETKKTELHVFEQWCYLETVDSAAGLAESAHTRYSLKFDLDVYKLIDKALLHSKSIIKIDNPYNSIS